jgi:hypothetical protein
VRNAGRVILEEQKPYVVVDGRSMITPVGIIKQPTKGKKSRNALIAVRTSVPSVTLKETTTPNPSKVLVLTCNSNPRPVSSFLKGGTHHTV